MCSKDARSRAAIRSSVSIVLVEQATQNARLQIKVVAMRKFVSVAATFVLIAAIAGPVHASRAIDCELHFSMSGWSAFYKHSSGSGTVTCDNGQSMKVRISAKGGGLTFGKSRIDHGLGKFTEVYAIDDIIGGYATAEAHAGANKSASARVVTKGPISLALSGKGRGWDIGVAFGNFIISRP